MNYIKYFLWAIIASLIFCIVSSCRTKKDVLYFQVPEDSSSNSRVEWKNFSKADSSSIKPYDPIIRSNDIIEVFVSSINQEAASYFNPVVGGNSMRNLAVSNPEILGYLVDVKGEIELPLIGSVKVAGLTVPMIKDTLKKKLEKYLESPSVRVIFQNYKVTVLGEVRSPGVYTVPNERITFTEALGLAGDLLITGNRKNILIVREENNRKEFATVDITNRKIFESPYYYLHPNDVVYVEPVAAKVESSDNFFRWYTFILTNITFLTVLLLNYGSR